MMSQNINAIKFTGQKKYTLCFATKVKCAPEIFYLEKHPYLEKLAHKCLSFAEHHEANAHANRVAWVEDRTQLTVTLSVTGQVHSILTCPFF